MGRATPQQTSFLGGEWSSYAQGRIDKPKYKEALARSLNGLPIEEGAWVRRPGTQRIIPTHHREQAVLRLFQSSSACAFAMEFAIDGTIRFYSGGQPIFDSTYQQIVSASYSSGAISMTLGASHDWAVGDSIMLNMDALDPSLHGGCRGRVLRITAASGATLTAKNDDLSNLTLPTWIANTLTSALVYHIKEISGPYTSNLNAIRIVQQQKNAIILHPSVTPYVLTVVDAVNTSSDPTFTLAQATFIDGPYLDPQGGPTTPETGTVSGYSGSINFTPTTTVPSALDVGRLIRVFTEPAAWNSGTTYSYGQTVKYNNQYWVAINQGAYAANNTNVTPGTLYQSSSGVSVALWGVAVNAASWGWGQIASVSGGHYTFTLQQNLNSANGSTVSMWQLGTFRSGNFPTCGVYHEGRLFLAGAEPNRWDASVSNDPFVFSYTDFFDVVDDSKGISYTLNSDDINNIQWMKVDREGVLCGTLTAEYLINASDNNDIITPTSAQTHQITHYGSSPNCEPRRVGMVLMLAQRYGRVLYEFMADAFSGRFSAKPLNDMAKHLVADGIAELAYQELPCPVLWVRTTSGQLLGCTYRRVSRFTTEDPVFNAWHQHLHGTPAGAPAFPVESMVMVPSEDGLSDKLYMVVNESDTTGKNYRYVEFMHLIPDAGNPTTGAAV